MTSAPASWTSQSSSTPVASRTRRVASAISGPVPSPGMSVTRCGMGAGAILARARACLRPFDTVPWTGKERMNELQARTRGRRRRRDGDRRAGPGGGRAPLPRSGHRGAASACIPTSRSGASSSTTASSPACPAPRTSRSRPARAARWPTSQAATARAGGRVGLGQLIDISDEQARDDLARLSAAMISIVAQSARGDQPRVPDDARRPGRDRRGALPAPLARRG